MREEIRWRDLRETVEKKKEKSDAAKDVGRRSRLQGIVNLGDSYISKLLSLIKKKNPGLFGCSHQNDAAELHYLIRPINIFKLSCFKLFIKT